MPNFAYIAKDRGGAEMTGIQSGASADHVIEDLHKKGWVVLHVAGGKEDAGR